MDPISTEPQVSPGIQQRSTRRKIGALIFALVVILAALGVWYFVYREASVEIAPGQSMVTADEGKVVRGFPQELILEDSAQIQSSYRIDYTEGNIKQPAAYYLSAMTFEENIAGFKEYFEKNGWEITREGKASERPATFFYARTMTAEANVLIVENSDKKVEVKISYVLEPQV